MDRPQHFLQLYKNQAKISGLWVQLTSPTDIICMAVTDMLSFDVNISPMTPCDPSKLKQHLAGQENASWNQNKLKK